jgi:hypothetical protein
MVGNLLLRGMFVGLIAGLLAFCFAKVFGEPQVDQAIAFEQQMDKAMGDMPGPELVSRPTQAGIGLFTGIVVYAASMGGLFALAFAFVQGRVLLLRPRVTAAVLALGAYVAIVVVPVIKYPANPPSIGDPATIRLRTALFLVMLATSIASLAVAVGVARRLSIRFGTWNAVLMAGVAFIVLIAVVQTVLPSVNEVPEHFSAVVLWRFRLASLGIQAVLWTTIGLAFGALTELSLAPPFRRSLIADYFRSPAPARRAATAD